MNHAVTTIADLEGEASHFTVWELHQLERTLSARVHELNDRIEDLLHTGHPADEDAISQVDVLCSAVGEVDELRRETERQLHELLIARRFRPRRARP